MRFDSKTFEFVITKRFERFDILSSTSKTHFIVISVEQNNLTDTYKYKCRLLAYSKYRIVNAIKFLWLKFLIQFKLVV